MARKTVITLVDDITGEVVERGEGETVAFSMRGTDYEIDLGPKNAEKFAKTMSFYIDHARRIGPSARGVVRRTPVPTEVDTVAVRAWAASNGVAVNARGRLPAAVIDKFRAAGN